MSPRSALRVYALRALVVGAAAILAAFWVVPSAWQVSRGSHVQGSALSLYRVTADLRRWDDWTPWNSRVDPGLTRTFGGALMGKSATAAWTGPRLGTTTIQITAADPLGGVAWRATDAAGAMDCRIDWVADGAEGHAVTWTCAGDEGRSPFARWRARRRTSALTADLDLGLAGLAAATIALDRETAASARPAPAPRPTRPDPPADPG